MRKVELWPITGFLMMLFMLFAFPYAYADITAFTDDQETVVQSFAEEYGWDPGSIHAAEWISREVEGMTYQRSTSYHKEYFKDLLEQAEEYCVENGIISVSRINGFGGRRMAAVARAEADAPDSIEVPVGSNRCKYNDWFYGVGGQAEWCAVFVCWCAKECGYIDSGLFKKIDNVKTMFRFLTNEQEFDSYSWTEVKQLGGGSYVPAPGDIFFFETFEHIGIITDVTDEGIEITHGNTGANADRVLTSFMTPSSRFFNRGTIVHVVYPYDDVEETVFYFLSDVMGFPTSAAAGILANIYVESKGFDLEAFNPDDPNGGSYGLCQWNGVRRTRLFDFCETNGYEYSSLE